MKGFKIGDMSFRVGTIAVATVLVAALALATAGISSAQTKITVGKTTSGSGFHIPSYVAMDKGFFNREGLNAKYVSMTGKALLNAGIAKQIGDMSFRVGTIAVATVLVAALTLATAGISSAQTKITVGRTTSGSGFHIPSYVAMDKGFFKREGLDAKYVTMSGKALLNAGIAKQIDFVPIPGGGSVAALRGAPIIYIVGQSLMGAPLSSL